MNIFRRWWPSIVETFRIDLRALAALRIGIACLLLVDLLSRLKWLRPFYTDAVFFTREWSQITSGSTAWSLYWIRGDVWWTVALLTINVIATLCLLLGYRTKVATLVCLILFYSLSARNPLVLDAGHVLIRMILFWNLFLPWGQIWSIDGRRKAEPVHDSVANVASAALLLQIAMMYFFAGLAKCHDYWWNGDALFNAMSLQMYARPLASTVRQLPSEWLLWLGRAVVVVELVGPLLLFMPKVHQWTRPLCLLFFWAMHIAIWLTLSIGIFAAAAMTAWLVFIPVHWWKAWFPQTFANRSGVFPHLHSTLKQRRRRQSWHIAGQILAVVFLTYVLLLNVSNIRHPWAKYALPESFRALGWLTMTAQEFRMFAHPPQESPQVTFVVVVEDPNRESAAPEDNAQEASKLLPDELEISGLPYSPTHATRRLNYNLIHFYETDPKNYQRLRNQWGQYLKSLWLRKHGDSLEVIQGALICEYFDTEPDRTLQLVRREVWWSFSE